MGIAERSRKRIKCPKCTSQNVEPVLTVICPRRTLSVPSPPHHSVSRLGRGPTAADQATADDSVFCSSHDRLGSRQGGLPWAPRRRRRDWPARYPFPLVGPCSPLRSRGEGRSQGGAAPATLPPGRMPLGKSARLPAAHTGTSRTHLPHGRNSPGIPRRTPGRVRDTREGQRGHPQEDWR
jgi:hypothetical protein